MTRRVLLSAFFAGGSRHAAGPRRTAQAGRQEGPEQPKLDIKLSAEDLAAKQIRMQALFSDFKSALLRLSQRMENSPKPEDREKGKILKQALEKANEEGIDNSFDKLVTILKAAKPDDQAALRPRP